MIARHAVHGIASEVFESVSQVRPDALVGLGDGFPVVLLDGDILRLVDIGNTRMLVIRLRSRRVVHLRESRDKQEMGIGTRQTGLGNVGRGEFVVEPGAGLDGGVGV